MRVAVPIPAVASASVFHSAGGGGSVEKTSRASVAQLVRARDYQSLGRRFDSV